MKAKLQNILGLAALGMTLVSAPVLTRAGLVTTQEVSINGNQTARWACGTLQDARYSADSTQSIACKTYTGTLSYTTCFARDSAGTTLSCVSLDNKFREMVEAMTDSSSICFQTDNTNNEGTCTSIYIANSSDLLK